MSRRLMDTIQPGTFGDGWEEVEVPDEYRMHPVVNIFTQKDALTKEIEGVMGGMLADGTDSMRKRFDTGRYGRDIVDRVVQRINQVAREGHYPVWARRSGDIVYMLREVDE